MCSATRKSSNYIFREYGHRPKGCRQNLHSYEQEKSPGAPDTQISLPQGTPQIGASAQPIFLFTISQGRSRLRINRRTQKLRKNRDSYSPDSFWFIGGLWFCWNFRFRSGDYLILRVASASTAKPAESSQNLTTTCGSDQPAKWKWWCIGAQRKRRFPPVYLK